MKPGIRVYCDDRDHMAYDQEGVIKAVRRVGKRVEFDILFDGPDGREGPEVTMGSGQIWPSDRDTEEARIWRAERALRVFLCHGSEDKQVVRALYQRVAGAGMKPWLDEEDLAPGVEWEPAIRRAVKDSHVILVCLSARSTSKVGFVQKEIRYALDRADEMPEGAVYVIPVRLEECAIPERLARWQAVDLYQPKGEERLLTALRHRAEALAHDS